MVSALPQLWFQHPRWGWFSNWTSTSISRCLSRHHLWHIPPCPGLLCVRISVFVFARTSMWWKLAYSTLWAREGKSIKWRMKSHIPPGLLRHILLRRCDLNYPASSWRRWATPPTLPAFGSGHMPWVLSGLGPPLFNCSHVLPQCSDVHFKGRQCWWRHLLPLAAAIPGPHHLRHRRAT